MVGLRSGLKVEPLKVVRVIARSPRLTRLHAELAALLNDKVHEEYVRAFEDEDDRRREWAASKVSPDEGISGASSCAELECRRRSSLKAASNADADCDQLGGCARHRSVSR